MIELHAAPGGGPAAETVAVIKAIAVRFPGEHELVVIADGHKLRLGQEWRFDASPACVAQLAEFGQVKVG